MQLFMEIMTKGVVVSMEKQMDITFESREKSTNSEFLKFSSASFFYEIKVALFEIDPRERKRDRDNKTM